jgi:hypothetical protein
MLDFSVDPDSTVAFGERFISYARRVRKLSLKRDIPKNFGDQERAVSQAVLHAWADATPQRLFPRMQSLSGQFGYTNTAAGARTVLRFLTPNIHHFNTICPDDFFLDAEEHAQLHASSAGLRKLSFSRLIGDQKAAMQLASTLASASTRYETVHIPWPLHPSKIEHLANCPRLRIANIELASPVPQTFSANSFGSLASLRVEDVTSELPGMHFCLALRSPVQLRCFSYCISRTGSSIDYASLYRFIRHITRWTTLTAISLDLRIDGTLSLKDYKTIYTEFHALSHLESLLWTGNTAVIFDELLMYDLLDTCPRLTRWRTWTSGSDHNGAEQMVFTLTAFVTLLTLYPDVHVLPIRVCCDKIPRPGAIADCGASKYGGHLLVMNVEDPDAVADVLRQVAPRVTDCILGFGTNDLIDEWQSEHVRDLNAQLKLKHAAIPSWRAWTPPSDMDYELELH